MRSLVQPAHDRAGDVVVVESLLARGGGLQDFMPPVGLGVCRVAAQL